MKRKQLGEEADRLQIKALLKGLENARWNTAEQARQELERRFERRFTYATVWNWLKNAQGYFGFLAPCMKKMKKGTHRSQRLSNATSLVSSKACHYQVRNQRSCGLLTKVAMVCCPTCAAPGLLILQTPSVNLDWTECFLQEIKNQYPDHEHIVVWDGAGFHAKDSSHEIVPDGVHIVTLPPYSPEFNPIEKLWDLIQDQTANKLWPTC